MSAASGLALVLGATGGFGLWLMVSRVPILRRPRLVHRVAPYVLDVSSAARDLVARRRVDPVRVASVVASPFGDRLAPIVHALLGTPDDVRARLRRARSLLTIERYRARQLGAATAGAALGSALGLVAAIRGATPAIGVALALVLVIAGPVLVDWMLQRAVRSRMARISSELPTVLELLALSLAAGEGLGDALRRIARVGSGELAREIGAVAADAAAGATLGDALQRLGRELGHPGVGRLVDQMRGALERGTPLAQTLHAQAQDARDASKRELLESAGRKEIAMLVPLVFALLPTTVAFALWPGIHVLQVGF